MLKVLNIISFDFESLFNVNTQAVKEKHFSYSIWVILVHQPKESPKSMSIISNDVKNSADVVRKTNVSCEM